MPLTLLLGGVRSGKSRLAARMAAHVRLPVVVIVTGRARDEEMADRIRAHRAERPSDWVTVEEPVELEGAIASVPGHAFVIVDCLTLWVANLMERGLSDDEVADIARKAAAVAAARVGGTVAVTNEVGSGVVPVHALARRFTDVLGRVNAVWAESSERALLMVAGRVVELAAADATVGGSPDA